ncbi:26S proteasome non-ATPase regulatory subunit 8-like [Zophobas morio]|uniref:26S proteasome non-ATPase regulatory subunit 8-like n=1 Tax=Zophobas morio TaxID=2755281 RepID=UPI003082B1B4
MLVSESDSEKKLVQLKGLLSLDKPDLERCGLLLRELNIDFLDKTFLPIVDETKLTELHLARDVLECGAIWCILKEDHQCFNRYMAQLKHFYFDLKQHLPTSPRQYEIIGAHLLNLLSQNRVPDFHSELELLDCASLHNNRFLAYPVLLEQYIVEGRTNKAFFEACQNPPTPYYAFFSRILENTTRRNMAVCIEMSFTCIPKEDVKRIFFTDDDQFIEELVAERHWILEKEKAFSYATELERII